MMVNTVFHYPYITVLTKECTHTVGSVWPYYKVTALTELTVKCKMTGRAEIRKRQPSAGSRERRDRVPQNTKLPEELSRLIANTENCICDQLSRE